MLGVVLVASEPLSRRSILRTYNAAATKTPGHRSLTAKRPVARCLSIGKTVNSSVFVVLKPAWEGRMMQ